MGSHGPSKQWPINFVPVLLRLLPSSLEGRVRVSVLVYSCFTVEVRPSNLLDCFSCLVGVVNYHSDAVNFIPFVQKLSHTSAKDNTM